MKAFFNVEEQLIFICTFFGSLFCSFLQNSNVTVPNMFYTRAMRSPGLLHFRGVGSGVGCLGCTEQVERNIIYLCLCDVVLCFSDFLYSNVKKLQWEGRVYAGSVLDICDAQVFMYVY